MDKDPFMILDYIKSSVEILMNLKAEEGATNNAASATQRSECQVGEAAKGYEHMLQKLEEEIRNHIRVEQQLKLHIENTQSTLEEYDNNKVKLKRLTDVLFIIGRNNYF